MFRTTASSGGQAAEGTGPCLASRLVSVQANLIDFSFVFSVPSGRGQATNVTQEYSILPAHSGSADAIMAIEAQEFQKFLSIVATLKLCLMALVALLLGCGRETGVEGYPPPGQMRVISIERIEEPDTNLLKNGDFANWWSGAPVADGFFAPQVEGVRMEQVRAEGRTGNSVLQTWSSPESELAPERLFHTVVNNLLPRNDYQLEVMASGSHAGIVRIEVWEVDAPGVGQTPLPTAYLTLCPGRNQAKSYILPFSTGDSGRFLIAARCASMTGEDASVVWHEWHVRVKRPTASEQGDSDGAST